MNHNNKMDCEPSDGDAQWIQRHRCTNEAEAGEQAHDNKSRSPSKRKLINLGYEERDSKRKNYLEKKVSSNKLRRIAAIKSDDNLAPSTHDFALHCPQGQSDILPTNEKPPVQCTGMADASVNSLITPHTVNLVSDHPQPPIADRMTDPPLIPVECEPVIASPLSLSSTLSEDASVAIDCASGIALFNKHQPPTHNLIQNEIIGQTDNGENRPSRTTRRSPSKTITIYDKSLDDGLSNDSASSHDTKMSNERDADYVPSDHPSTLSDDPCSKVNRSTMTRCSRKAAINEPLVLCCNTMTRQSKRKKIKRPNITVYEIDPNRSLRWNMENYIMNQFFTEDHYQLGGKEMLQKFSKKAKKRREKICSLWNKYGVKFFDEQFASKTSKVIKTSNDNTTSAYPACYVEISCETLCRDLDIKTDYETILKILHGIGARFDTAVTRNMIDGLSIENRFTLHIKDLFDLLRHLDDELMADWYEIYCKNQMLYPNEHQYATVWSDNDSNNGKQSPYASEEVSEITRHNNTFNHTSS